MTVRCAEALSEAIPRTKAPPRYTEATLLPRHGGCRKIVDDVELREAMKERGLGTPATRAEIIETLIRREYVDRIGKELAPTPKGLQVITMLEGHQPTSPDLTGDWEKRLRDIEHGRATGPPSWAPSPNSPARLWRRSPPSTRRSSSPSGSSSASAPAAGPRPARSSRRTAALTAARAGSPGRKRAVASSSGSGSPAAPSPPRSPASSSRSGKTWRSWRGFRSRAGKPFRARLVLTDGKVEFEFPQRRAAAETSAGGEPAGS